MRVLMLHNRYLIPGGEDQSTAAEVALLSDYGHQVELLEQDNRNIERLGKAATAVRTLWSSDSYRTIESKLKSGGFDLLHVQNFFPLWSPSVYHAAWNCGVPVVQTLRNFRLLCVNAIFYRDGHVCQDCLGKVVPWSGVRHGCYRQSRTGSAVLASMIGVHKLLGTWRNRVQAYIALTQFAREQFVAGGWPAEKIVVKPNFVHPTPPPGSGHGGYALFVGRLSPEKGIATMLQAWKSAERPLPLKIVGEGPLEPMVREAAADIPAIEYLGRRPYQEVFDLMRAADLLVFPSECFENMPRTVIESFAVGTPVLAADLGATASMVEHGTNGFHFAPGDVASLRSQLEWCSRNLSGVRALRANARAEFEARYTGEANIAQLLAIYRQAQEIRTQAQALH